MGLQGEVRAFGGVSLFGPRETSQTTVLFSLTLRVTDVNQNLIDHIDAKIESAARFVCAYMPVDITVDSAYEAMLACSAINTVPMIAAFKEAVKYLDPVGNFKRFNFSLGDGRIASIQARFTPSKTWPAFLIPTGNLAIDPESKFAALLDTPIRVATEWESLAYVWQQLRHPQHGLDHAMLAYLMPWIRECLADFDMTDLPVSVARIERKAIEKELSTVMNDANVLFFPRLSKQLTAIARSGKTLFGQYRILEAAYSRETLTQSPITVERTPSLLEPWVKEHISEATDEWTRDKAERTARRLEAVMMKAAARFGKANPKGK